MSTPDFGPHVDAAAALIGLTIPAEYREGVVRYFGIARNMAELVMQHPLTPADEPAALFVPVAAPGSP